MSPPSILEIVIVSYRCEELLRSCLRSIAQAASEAPVHVVDNASGDGTAKMVASEFPHVRLLTCTQNHGFGAANNLVLREIAAPYVLVLNPDTRLTEGATDCLLNLLEARPEVGICGPRLVREDGTLDHASRRSFPTPLSALGHFSGLGRHPRAPARLAAYRAPGVESGPVDAVNGAFMLIRRTALEAVGYFDERYWMYMEDLDLCYRFARRGWITWFEPTVTAIHIKGGSTAVGRGPRLQVAFHRGMDRFYGDHYGPGRNPALNLIVRAGIAAKLGTSLALDAAKASGVHAPGGRPSRPSAESLTPARRDRARLAAAGKPGPRPERSLARAQPSRRSGSR